MAMKEFSASIEIHAKAEKIWAILTDVSKYTEWDKGMMELQGRIVKGGRLAIRATISPNQVFKPTVTEFEANRRMVWSSGMPFGLFKGARTFTLEPVNNGRVKFTLHEQFSGPMMLMIGNTIPDLTATFETFAQALKQRAEA